METLTLNDGTVLTGHCICDGGNLFVYLDRMDLDEGVELFSDPGRTEKIIEENHGNIHEYDGYTQLYDSSREYGNCNLVMRKG